MDYLLQIEKMFKYLEFNLELGDMQKMLNLKKDFNNDFNLLGCFIKDFLTLENEGAITKDDEIYNDFVICFEKNLDKISSFINKLTNYSKHYLTIVFEDTENRVLMSTIAVVNSCFAMELYPFLMELMQKYIDQSIDRISFALMLQYLSDVVIKNFDCASPNLPTLKELRNHLGKISSSRTIERQAV